VRVDCNQRGLVRSVNHGRACFQSTRCWEVCQTWVTYSAGLGLGFFRRCRSRILRAEMEKGWLYDRDNCFLWRLSGGAASVAERYKLQSGVSVLDVFIYRGSVAMFC